MRKVLAFVLVAFIVFASGCIGNSVGLTEEKIVNAIQNLETARYEQNFSMSMYFVDPDTNETVNFSMAGHVVGILNKTADLETGNMSIVMHIMGMDVNMDWPYFVNGTNVYFNVDGQWYYVPPSEDLHNQVQGSLNLDYIKNILDEKNVTIKKLSDGYAFRVNMTFWEFMNATNQSSYFTKMWKGDDLVNVTTNSGWVEVHLRKDGTPTYIETHMNLMVTVRDYDGKTTDIYMTVHETVTLSDINEHFAITAPRGIEKARNFDEVFG